MDVKLRCIMDENQVAELGYSDLSFTQILHSTCFSSISGEMW